jgi:hypothetical protein
LHPLESAALSRRTPIADIWRTSQTTTAEPSQSSSLSDGSCPEPAIRNREGRTLLRPDAIGEPAERLLGRKAKFSP